MDVLTPKLSNKPTFPQIRVILVGSMYDSNVGSTSRVMSNLAVNELILVRPQCEITYSAQQAAATGQFALQNRKTYSTWSEFLRVEDGGVRLAMTARQGQGRAQQSLREVLRNLPEGRQAVLRKGDSLGDRTEGVPAGNLQRSLMSRSLDFVFGPEQAGLTTDDLSHVHLMAHLPEFGGNPSFNLSHAVLLTLWMAREEIAPTDQPSSSAFERKSSVEPVVPFPEHSLRKWLIALGLNVDDRRRSALSVLRRLLLRSTPTSEENAMLEVVLEQSARKLGAYNHERNALPPAPHPPQ